MIYLIAKIKENGQEKYKLLNYNVNTKEIKTKIVSLTELKQYKTENVKVEKNEVKGINGSIDRYTEIENGEYKKKSIVILGKYEGIDKYIISNATGDVEEGTEADIIEFLEKYKEYGIANGKIVEKDKKYLSAIEGEYKVFEEHNNNKYYIMHKNDKVIEFTKDINDIQGFNIINDKLIPICVKSKNIDRYDLMNWLVNRRMPQSRQTTQFIMKIKHIRDYNQLFENSLYLSLSDYYWVKPVDSSIKWEEVNFFNNTFSNELSNLVLMGEKGWDNNELDIFKENPSKNVNGELSKCWKIIDGKRKLIKRTMLNNNQDVFAEVVISKVLKKYGYNVVDYDLIKVDDEYCCICDTMCQNDYELLQAEYYNKDLIEYIKEYPEFIDIAVIDYIIGNFDRHGLNFGLLRKWDGSKWEYKQAPIYDNECGLWSKFKEVRNTPYNFSDKLEIKSMEDIIKTLEPICKRKPILKEGVKDIAKDIYNIWKEKYREVVNEEFVKSRCNEIQKRIDKLSKRG